jgi:uncharacterized membrane protein
MMTGAATSVLGIVIPSTSPLFLATVGFHILTGLGAVITGAVAMLSKKGSPRHIGFGRTYFWCLTALFASASALAFARWADDYQLFVLGVLAYGAAMFGRSAARRKWRSWQRLHMSGMGLSYILMLTAFYVDNGMNLPIWRDLPHVVYWVAPAVLGLPIMIWALLRHPLVRPIKSSALIGG